MRKPKATQVTTETEMPERNVRMTVNVHRLRLLPFDIPSYSSFDFLGTLTEIERFGMENMLPPVATRNLQLFFEEMIMQNIVPHINSQKNGYPIRCVIEHSEANWTTTFSIDYGGDSYNPILDGSRT